MRYYSLKFGSSATNRPVNSLTEVYPYEITSSDKNRTPLNIQFNVKAFESGAAETIGFVKIFNISPTTFARAADLIGQKIKLEAGFETSPFTKKLNYANVVNKTIFAGEIANVLGNFSSENTYMSLYFNVNSVETLKLRESEKAIEVSIAPNTSVLNPLTQAIKTFTKFTIYPETSLISLVSTASQTISFTARTLKELLTKTEAYLQIKHAFDGANSTISLYKNKQPSALQSLAVTINASELLAQPEVLDFAGSLSVVMRLRADIRLGSNVNLVGIIPTIGSALSSSNYIGSVVRTRELFRLGSYKVIGVDHTGDYYGTAPESWSTSLSLVPNTPTALT